MISPSSFRLRSTRTFTGAKYSIPSSLLPFQTAIFTDDLASYVLHAIVGRPATSFRDHPVDILAGIFNVARFAMYAILRIYLKTLPVARLQRDEFVDTWEQKKAESRTDMGENCWQHCSFSNDSLYVTLFVKS